jgi:ABC-2 type transport system permease protein
VLPAKRVAEVLAFVGAILAMVFSQWSNLSGTESGSITAEQISSGTRTLSVLNTAWSPLAWGGRGLVELGEGHWLTGLFFLILTLALSGSVFWFALGTAERLYYSGWASMQVGTRRKAVRVRTKEAASVQRQRFGSLVQQLVPPEVRAIMFKDSLQLRRDLRNLSQLVTPLIMGIVFAVMLLRGGGKAPAGRGEAPEAFMEALRIMIAYGSMAISLFVGWSLLSRLALIAFSMESRSYWMIKTSPVSLRRLLAAKFLVAYLPALGVGWLFLLGIAILQKVPLATVIYGLPAIALILAGLDGINLALGIRGADFTWTDPRRMAGGGVGCVSMLASMAYLLVASLLFFAPAVAAPLLGLPEVLGQMVGLLVGGAAALLCAALPLASLKGRLQRLGED